MLTTGTNKVALFTCFHVFFQFLNPIVQNSLVLSCKKAKNIRVLMCCNYLYIFHLWSSIPNGRLLKFSKLYIVLKIKNKSFLKWEVKCGTNINKGKKSGKVYAETWRGSLFLSVYLKNAGL